MKRISASSFFCSLEKISLNLSEENVDFKKNLIYIYLTAIYLNKYTRKKILFVVNGEGLHNWKRTL